MKTLQFEGIKVALKQDKTGYVLTLSMHPDDVPIELLRDFVGARYQVVMVRLNGDEEPMDRQNEFEGDQYVRTAGMLCKDTQFWEYLYEDSQILEENERTVTEWLRNYLGIKSRAELKINKQAREHLGQLLKEFTEWKKN